MSLFYILILLQISHLSAPNFLPCDVNLEYLINNNKHNEYYLDTSRMQLDLIITEVENSMDLKFNYTTILNSPDFVNAYCNNSSCTINDVVSELNKNRIGQIIVEFEDGYFCFYTSIRFGVAFTNYSLAESYDITHLNQDYYFQKTIDKNAKVAHFLGSKIRFYFILTQIKDCIELPINFRTDWIDVKELLQH